MVGTDTLVEHDCSNRDCANFALFGRLAAIDSCPKPRHQAAHNAGSTITTINASKIKAAAVAAVLAPTRAVESPRPAAATTPLATTQPEAAEHQQRQDGSNEMI